MVDYSHFRRSAVCASSGLYVGREGSEVQVTDGSGNLFQAGTQITASGTQLNRTIGGVSSGIRIATGMIAASPSATIDTGLTTVTGAMLTVVGKAIGSNAISSLAEASLDTANTPDAAIDAGGFACKAEYRIVSTNDLWIKAYMLGSDSSSSLDPCVKRTAVRWLAIGT